VMRQALAGMLWSKQYFCYDVNKWLEEHRADPLLAETGAMRNREWFHMINEHVISMPDKWEYPWFAARDLAFHATAFATIDPDFAKQQLDLLLLGLYLHPSGQIPAYEWNFSEVNPPGARLGRDLSLPNRAGFARPDRPRIPDADVWQADVEFRLVGQPQRPQWP
jgi:hypothetical protein